MTNTKKPSRGGGVQTEKGKAITKLNALQHGILSQEAVLKRGELKENVEEHETLRTRLFNDLQPEGMVEIMLVDKLFTFYWRLRRLVRTERALVEAMTIGHSKKYERNKAFNESISTLTHEIAGKTAGPKLEDLYPLVDVFSMMAYTAEEGDLPSEEEMDALIPLRGDKQLEDMALGLRLQHACITEEAKRSGKDILTPKRLTIFIQTAKKASQDIESYIDSMEREDRESSDAATETHAIPTADDLQRIQRYEAFLNRSFTQTLHELQRVQSKRKGEQGPPTAALDVSVDTGEFVS